MKLFRITACFFLAVSLLFALPLPTSAQEATKTDWSRVFFLGESTTAHLRRRGTLLGQYAKTNVLAPDSGTLTLSSRTLAQTIRKDGTTEKISILEAIRQKTPPILILSFGLNGIAGFHQNENNYLQLYRKLIQTIRQASPDTLLILQTIYPVAERQTNWKFSAPPGEVNLWIVLLNRRLQELGAGENLPVLDTAALLRDETGFLKPLYSADGIHLTNAGYDAVLRYIAENTEKLRL